MRIVQQLQRNRCLSKRQVTTSKLTFFSERKMTHFKAFSNIAVVRDTQKQNALFSDHVPKRTCSHPFFTQNALQQCIPFLFPELYTITVKCFNSEIWDCRCPIFYYKVYSPSFSNKTLYLNFAEIYLQVALVLSILWPSLWLTSIIFSMESLCLQ